MKNIETYKQSTLIRAIVIQAVIVIIVSLLVMIGWVFKIPILLSIFKEDPTMKFNTALGFLLSGIGLISFLQYEKKIFRLITIFLALTIFFLGTFTFLDYFLNFNFSIDQYFVKDIYSTVFPGRMSPATAFCFSLFGISLFAANSKYSILKKIGQHIALIILLIAMIGVFTFILGTASNMFFFNTLAIHTAILFHLLAESVSLKNSSYGFSGFFLGEMYGSRLIRWMLPFIIAFPLVLGYVLLYLLKNKAFEQSYGITFFILILAIASILYISFVAIHLNKTHLKQIKLENQLFSINEEIKQFKYALDESSIVTVTDANGIVTYVNDKFCEISKYKREELIGKTLKIINSGHHSKSFYDELWEKISKGNVWMGGIKNKAKDGNFYWVHTAIVPFMDENKTIYQYLAIQQDITQHHMLSSQYENLKLKNKEIEQFTYIASHDLQEPLRTVTGMIEILEEKFHNQMDDEAKICFDFTLEATARMSDLIKGLLDYSQIGNDKKLEEVDLNNMIDFVKKDISKFLEETNSEVTVDNLPTLKVYRNHLRLVFQNLMLNAIKFQKKGNIPKIHIMAEEMEEYWKICVEDNGIGISEANMLKVFGIFQRLNNRSDYEGAGLGLAHCEKIVHLHGGNIWVKSKPNTGSKFYFTISKTLN